MSAYTYSATERSDMCTPRVLGNVIGNYLGRPQIPSKPVTDTQYELVDVEPFRAAAYYRLGVRNRWEADSATEPIAATESCGSILRLVTIRFK